jgi:hypothetical protein
MSSNSIKFNSEIQELQYPKLIKRHKSILSITDKSTEVAEPIIKNNSSTSFTDSSFRLLENSDKILIIESTSRSIATDSDSKLKNGLSMLHPDQLNDIAQSDQTSLQKGTSVVLEANLPKSEEATVVIEANESPLIY